MPTYEEALAQASSLLTPTNPADLQLTIAEAERGAAFYGSAAGTSGNPAGAVGALQAVVNAARARLAARASDASLQALPAPEGSLLAGKAVFLENPVALGLGALGAVATVGVGAAAITSAVRGRKKSKSHKAAGAKRTGQGTRPSGSSKNRKRNRPGGAVKQRYKGKRVYLTKNGQPYVLLASGKARFVRR